MTIAPITFPAVSGMDALTGASGLAGTAGVSGVAGPSGTAGVAGPSGVAAPDPSGFAGVLAQSVDALQAQHTQVDTLATQAATGDLRDVHDYMIAANEAQLGTEMLVSVRNKAVDAFNEILRMQI